MSLTSSIRILFEEPASQDAFDGQGHQRIADSLVTVISQLKVRGGAIGLEGAWGSGKSTVVRLAAQSLSKSVHLGRTAGMFTYDAWSHQREDFRQSLLTQLLSYARTSVPSLEGYCKLSLKEINTKATQTEKTADRAYSLPALYFLFLTPLLPLVLTWLGPAGVSKPPVIFGQSLLTVMFVAIGIGYGLMALKFVSALWRFRATVVEGEFLRWLRKAASSAAAIFSKDAEAETTIVTVFDEAPVESKFAALFERTISRLRDSGHDVVVVLDNIDRLPKEKMSSVWADMQLIIRGSERSVVGGAVVVVAYDKRHVQSMMQTGYDASLDELTSKTFTRILRVAPPVLKDWQKYLFRCLDYVFVGSIEDVDKHKIFRVLDHKYSADGVNPTPRHIVAFTNGLAGLWSQWDGRLSLGAIAIYLAYREKIEGGVGVASVVDLVDAVSVGVVDDPDWYKDVAAIVTNVPPEYAYQVMLAPAISAALLQPKGEVNLVSIQRVPGFDETLRRLVGSGARSWASNPSNYADIVNRVAVLESKGLNEVWSYLGDAIESLPVGPLALGVVKGVPSLSMLVAKQTKERIAPVGGHLSTWLAECILQTAGDHVALGQLWFETLQPIAHAAGLQSHEVELELLGRCVDPPTAASFIGAAIASDRHGHADIVPESSFTHPAVSEALLTYINDGGAEPHHAVRAIGPELFGDSALTLVAALSERLKQPSAAGLEGIVIAMADLLSRLKDLPTYSSPTPAFVTDGSLLAVGFADGVSERGRAAAIWLISGLSKAASITVPAEHPSYGDLGPVAAAYMSQLNGTLSPDALADLASWIEASGQFKMWLDFALDGGFSMHRDALTVVVDRDKWLLMSVAQVVARFDDVVEKLGDQTAAKLTRSFGRWSKFFPNAFGGEKILSISPKFIELAKHDTGEVRWFIRELDKQLQAITEAGWREALEIDNGLLRLVLARKEPNLGYVPALHFRSALLGHAQAIIDGKSPSSVELLRWREVVALLSPRARETFLSKLYGKLTKAKVGNAEWDLFMLHYGPYVRRMPLTRKPVGTIDRILIPLIGSSIPASAEILADTVGELSQIVAAASRKAQGRLKAAIEAAAGSGNELLKQKAAQVAVAFPNS